HPTLHSLPTRRSSDLISGKPTSSNNKSGLQLPIAALQSEAVCQRQTTFAIPDSSISVFRPSVRTLWSSTIATLIIFTLFISFQFNVHFCALARGVNIHFSLKSFYTLPNIP